jgi:hypothetical protein
MMKTKKKLQKPIDQEINLKYRCSQCNQDHWLSWRQAATINFKVVCDCGEVFKVKRVTDFKINYLKKVLAIEPPKEHHKISNDLLEKATKLLIGYGFTKIEAIELVNKSYEENRVDDYVILVKQTLESIRN